MSQLVIPDECPNCLSVPAHTRVSIVRTVGVPFGGYISHRGEWPFCARCAGWVTRHARWKSRYVMTPATLLAVASCAVAVLTYDHGMHRSTGWLLLAAIVVAVSGTLVANLTQWLAKTPPGCLSNFPVVAPIRGGSAFLSGRVFGEFGFLHPVYVDRLLALNSPDNVSTKRSALDKSRARFDAGSKPLDE